MDNLSKQTQLEQAQFLLEYYRQTLNRVIEEHSKAKKRVRTVRAQFKAQETLVQQLRQDNVAV